VTDFLRRAGRAELAHDDVVLWSVAEGARGRRWRWMHQLDQGFQGNSGTLELLPDGRLGRLEIAAFGGLLTFHPEADGLSAHGNIVTPEGVKPIETSWRPEWRVGILGDPFGSAIAGWAGFGFVVSWQGQLPEGMMWREPGRHDDVTALECDDRGVPLLERGEEWPLEE
jgi:hypothetical protein